MEEVKRHPWFQYQLPEGALTMNESYIAPVPYLGEVCTSLCRARPGLCYMQLSHPAFS